MFESNFPVDQGSYSYPVFWNACKLLTEGASSSEKADLFAQTANAVLSARRDRLTVIALHLGHLAH
jgi:predicted TIM-barrel fold metal-dependent hydrolase